MDDQQIVLCPYRQTVLVFNKIEQQALDFWTYIRKFIKLYSTKNKIEQSTKEKQVEPWNTQIIMQAKFTSIHQRETPEQIRMPWQFKILNHRHLHFPDLDIVGRLEPPDGLSSTLEKCYLFSFLHHPLLLYMETKWVYYNDEDVIVWNLYNLNFRIQKI